MPLEFTPNASRYQAFVQCTLNEFHVALAAIYTAGVVEKTTKLDYFLRLAVVHTYVCAKQSISGHFRSYVCNRLWS